MQLTASDETDLLLPLYGGVHDKAEWPAFLVRLRRRTGADYASLIFAQGRGPIHASNEVFSGRNLREEARELGLDSLYDMDRTPYYDLRPGRVYAAEEFVVGDPGFRQYHERMSVGLGLSDERIVRIREVQGASAWLIIARASGSFSAADSALLSALCPHVAVALHGFVRSERLRIRAMADREGLGRAGVGWIALGNDAQIVDMDDNFRDFLRSEKISERMMGARIASSAGESVRAMAVREGRGGVRSGSSAFVVNILDAPRMDAIIVPVGERPGVALAMPVALAFFRMPGGDSDAGKEALAAIFGLTLRQAELAVAISRGESIQDAARQMGLTSETARNYSKHIYAKMSVSGQSQLVRKILLSSASLSGSRSVRQDAPGGVRSTALRAPIGSTPVDRRGIKGLSPNG